jgi:predicted ATPase
MELRVGVRDEGLARLRDHLNELAPLPGDLSRAAQQALDLARQGFPGPAVACCGQSLEALLQHVWRHHRIKGDPARKHLSDLLNVLREQLPVAVQDDCEVLRQRRNGASHAGRELDADDALYVLTLLIRIIRWFSGTDAAQVSLAPVHPPSLQTSKPPKPQARPSTGEFATRPPASLVGRQLELAFLEAAIARVAQDDGSVEGPSEERFILLRGESGSGKSALMKHAEYLAKRRGMDVVSAACEPFHEGMSFFPVRELMRQLVGESSVSAVVSAWYGSSSTQAALASVAEHASADASSRRDALIATFANMVLGRWRDGNGARPLLVSIDDMEWIDRGTVDALLCLVSRLREGRVIILGAYRTDVVRAADNDGGHNLRPLIEQVARSPLLTVQDVGALSAAHTRELTQSLLPGEVRLPYRFFEQLHAVTEGNALFTTETVRGMSRAEDGPLQQIDGLWQLSGPLDAWSVPDTVEDAVRARLDLLDSNQRKELETASVIGRRFAFEVIAVLSAREEDELLATLEELLDVDLIRELYDEDASFEFSHGLIRDVLYKAMSSVRRRRLHGQVADALTNLRDVLSEDWDALIGEHYHQARRYRKALPRLLSAARSATALQAGREASSLFAKALAAIEHLEELPEGESFQEIRLEHAGSLKLASTYNEAAAIYEQLIDDPGTEERLRGRALQHLGDILWLSGDAGRAREVYAKAAAQAIAIGDDVLQLQVVAALCELHDREAERFAGVDFAVEQKHRERSDQYLDEQLRLANGVGDEFSRSRALRNDAKRLRRQGRLEEAVERYERAVALLDPRIATHSVLISYAKTLRFVGRQREAQEIIARVLEWSLQTGALRTQAIARHYRAVLLVEVGENQLDEARRELHSALELHQEIGYDRGTREVQLFLGELSLLAGDAELATSWFSRAVAAPGGTEARDLRDLVIAQLRAIGEQDRAERVMRTWPTGGEAV